MTLTTARPHESPGAPTPEATSPPAAATVAESVLTTSDHKRIGRYYLAAGMAFVLAGTAVALVMEVSLSSSGTAVSGPLYDRLFSLHSTVTSLLFVPLLFTGLATYLVPLQIGARRLAFPRLQALALWTTVVGGLLLLASYTFGRPNGWGIAYPTALPFVREGASRATDLWTAALVLITVAAVLSAANLLTTILKLRAPGMTMGRLPAFSWSVFVVSAGMVLVAPLFVAGLLLLYLDQHFGGGLFAPGQLNADLVWQHLLWLYGRPDAYLVIVPALGALTDLVATHARRPLVRPMVVKAAITATAVACFGILAANGSIERAVLLPTPSALSAVVAVPIGVIVLLWLASMRPGAVRPHVSLLSVAGFAVLLGAGLLNALIAPSQHLGGGLTGSGSAWTVGQLHAVLFGAPTLAAFAAIFHWAPKIYGRALNAAAGALQGLLLIGGFLLAALGSWLAGYDGAPWHVAAYTGVHAGRDANFAKLSAAGGVLVALGLLVFVANAASAWLWGAEEGAADPYHAGTLEWACPSPPGPDNFDVVPEIRSASPLADWRAEQAAGAPGTPVGA